MQTGKKINQISNVSVDGPGQSRKQSGSAVHREYFKLYFSRISEQICLSEGY